jgi:cytochrome c-type biogenesis protein CcmH
LKLILVTLFFILFNISFLYSKSNSESKNIEAYELYEELRCLVCQNQSLLESNAPLAVDLKTLVLDKLEAGQSKDEIKIFLVERYGEFILLKPTYSYKNILLWLGPIIFLAFGFLVTFKSFRNKPLSNEDYSSLTQAEKEELNKILGKDSKK